MRAVVIATGRQGASMPFADRLPHCLLPLVDRPFLQHVVESLVEVGFDRIDFVLHHLPECIEGLLGGGERWGAHFRYHLARQDERPYDVLAILAGGEPLLLVHGDTLVRAPVAHDRPPLAGPAVAYCLAEPDPTGRRWTGWAWLPPGAAARLARLPLSLHRPLLSGYRPVLVPPPLRCDSPSALLAANRACLDGRVPELLMTGREREPGVRLGRGAVVHPTACLEPPVFLGEGVRVGPRAQVGPHASIGAGCLLDEECAVSDAIVLPGTFVGRQLEIRAALVDRDRLASAPHAAEVRVADAFLLGGVAPAGAGRWCGRLGSRLLASALLCAAAPVLALAAAWKRLVDGPGVVERRPFLRLPADGPGPRTVATVHRLRGGASDGAGPSDLLHRVLPGLLAVARGDLRFVGVEPRSPEGVDALPADWRELYLRCEAGLICEAPVRCGPRPCADDLRASECFYAVRRGMRRDLGILWAYGAALCRPTFRAPGRAAATLAGA